MANRYTRIFDAGGLQIIVWGIGSQLRACSVRLRQDAKLTDSIRHAMQNSVPDAEFVTVAKAYSGITDAELREIDRYVRKNVTRKYGPVRSVRPEIVLEVAFEGVRASRRHKSGVALRFPRIQRWRKDKEPNEVDTLENLIGYARMGEPKQGDGPRTDDAGNLLLF